jgi:hypothetical protein
MNARLKPRTTQNHLEALLQSQLHLYTLLFVKSRDLYNKNYIINLHQSMHKEWLTLGRLQSLCKSNK